jgi:hypothetical protein
VVWQFGVQKSVVVAQSGVFPEVQMSETNPDSSRSGKRV